MGTRKLIVGLPLAVMITLVILCHTAGAKPVLKSSIDEKRLEALWAELEKDDADATRALLKLSAMPKEATAFLGQKLKPLKIDAEQVTALLNQLGSDDEAVWK